ncbi:MAG: LLM class F420-dependent oxidoreductase [Pseudomonadota bacterium]|nr:LLM class F420-dependent oxidoreductase [Pseudomonadota bacterium]
MKFGMSIIVRGDEAGPETFDAMARTAEATGLEALWASDHLLMMPMLESKYPGTADGQMPDPWKRKYFQPFSVLNFLAGRTTRVRLGTSVLILPMRNPLEMAAQLAELDVVSGGRLNVGIGVGWYKEEYQALGYDFGSRGKRCDEGLEILKRLWSGEPASWDGPSYRFTDARLGPAPRQRPHPPVYIGGHTKAAICRVARHGDVWHPFKLNPADVAALLPTLKDALAAEGRSGDGFPVAPKVTLVIRDTPHQEGEPPTHGTPQQIVDTIHRFEDLGVTELCFDIAPETCTNAVATMERFADTIRPKL